MLFLKLTKPVISVLPINLDLDLNGLVSVVLPAGLSLKYCQKISHFGIKVTIFYEIIYWNYIMKIFGIIDLCVIYFTFTIIKRSSVSEYSFAAVVDSCLTTITVSLTSQFRPKSGATQL